jgi:hypothetical protein
VELWRRTGTTATDDSKLPCWELSGETREEEKEEEEQEERWTAQENALRERRAVLRY